MKKICIITDRYPYTDYPVNTFLEQLVNNFADLGVECDVIAPYCPFIDKMQGKKYNPLLHDKRITKSGNMVNVYCPTFFCLSGRKRFDIDFAKFYVKKHCQASMRMVEKINKEYDAFYAHFVVPSTLTAVELGKKYHKPVFFAYGESSINIISDRFDLEYIRKKLESVAGVVSVSSKNKKELVSYNLIPEEKIGVFPNSIDSTSFYVINKEEARRRVGIAPDDFVVAFVGHFINRKGSRRLSDALDQFDDVKSIFIGAGIEAPTCKGIVFAGKLPHDKIVTYLNAADVFVLPTLAEGCCNAIIEAMACGLPIISSDLPFNDDILNERNSIRIDPNNVEAIVNAIRLLKNSPEMRKEKSLAALKTAKELTLQKRAENIIKFIDKKILE